MPPDLRRLAAASEDAFDAAASALVMAAEVEELRALPDAPGYESEGKIWRPQRPPRGRWEAAATGPTPGRRSRPGRR
jgi:hypothetical protein